MNSKDIKAPQKSLSRISSQKKQKGASLYQNPPFVDKDTLAQGKTSFSLQQKAPQSIPTRQRKAKRKQNQFDEGQANDLFGASEARRTSIIRAIRNPYRQNAQVDIRVNVGPRLKIPKNPEPKNKKLAKFIARGRGIKKLTPDDQIPINPDLDQLNQEEIAESSNLNIRKSLDVSSKPNLSTFHISSEQVNPVPRISGNKLFTLLHIDKFAHLMETLDRVERNIGLIMGKLDEISGDVEQILACLQRIEVAISQNTRTNTRIRSAKVRG
ncbi:hypothetical protein FGO68_gene1633 [Halteria grandinella]|uniref:Uncharacterized protein n=1 Tax=Halteria grandinella TaxID=5974 RepID=A0A8J8NK83_HALGN|nr:hypothetical protein FGO68_gene1633 [Halteria grandinella]